MTKPRRTVPRKSRRPPPEIEAISNRARRREAIEAAGRDRRRAPVFPQPEDEGRYTP